MFIRSYASIETILKIMLANIRNLFSFLNTKFSS